MLRWPRVLVVFVLLCGVAPSVVSGSSVGGSWRPVASCGRFHVALANDSWSRLAVRFGLGERVLYRLNGASEASFLRAGDRVCVGSKVASSTVAGTTTTSPTTTTSTTTTTTTTMTTTVSLPVAPVLTVGALESCGRVSVSWSGASPDTGRYSVQWVPVSSGSYSFNSYTMFDVRGSSTVLPNWFGAGSTYAIRVFAMRADWDGLWHSTQNVTPHSAVVTFTLPSCNPPEIATTTTTTVALTCAAGGTCAVGDTGPGGGIVFYVAGANFTSTGSDCNTTCKYLEAAPTDQSTGIVWATTAAACYVVGSDAGTSNCQLNSIYSSTSDQAASRTAAVGIGMGMANTNQIYARLTTEGLASTSTYAAGIAWAYTNNGKSDWHLPSRDELNELCKYARTQTTGTTTTVCADSGTLREGFASVWYWSSREASLGNASIQLFATGRQGTSTKADGFRVRPVRAFG